MIWYDMHIMSLIDTPSRVYLVTRLTLCYCRRVMGRLKMIGDLRCCMMKANTLMRITPHGCTRRIYSLRLHCTRASLRTEYKVDSIGRSQYCSPKISMDTLEQDTEWTRKQWINFSISYSMSSSSSSRKTQKESEEVEIEPNHNISINLVLRSHTQAKKK